MLLSSDAFTFTANCTRDEDRHLAEHLSDRFSSSCLKKRREKQSLHLSPSAMSTPASRAPAPRPPEKGVFPLDHFGECKEVRREQLMFSGSQALAYCETRCHMGRRWSPWSVCSVCDGLAMIGVRR